MKKKMINVGQELTFDVYGTKIIGKFISFEKNDLIKIEVTFDEIGVNTVGQVATVNNNYLVTTIKEEQGSGETLVENIEEVPLFKWDKPNEEMPLPNVTPNE
jgi:hypothetical protein